MGDSRFKRKEEAARLGCSGDERLMGEGRGRGSLRCYTP